MNRIPRIAPLAVAAAISPLATHAKVDAQFTEPPANPGMESIRQEALKHPNETVSCNLSSNNFYAPWRVCYPLMAEFRFVMANLHGANEYALLDRCAADLGRPFAAKSEAERLNLCSDMIKGLKMEEARDYRR